MAADCPPKLAIRLVNFELPDLMVVETDVVGLTPIAAGVVASGGAGRPVQDEQLGPFQANGVDSVQQGHRDRRCGTRLFNADWVT